MGNARQQRGVVDFVTVKMQDRQHRPVPNGIQELVGMPGGSQRPSFGFAVTYYHCNQQVRVIEGGAKGMGDAVTQLASFVDGTWSLRRAMATDAAREGEFLKELQHPLLIFALVWVDFRVSALEIDRRQHSRRAMTGSSQKDSAQVVLNDQTVEMNVSEAQAWTGSPVPQQALLDMFRLERF